jgi:hypothetical protein
MMYPQLPFLPGFMDRQIEGTRGADVGATMWAFVPYGAIQHHAVFTDHEFPLWNRYNFAGTSLLGQGISMIGDPLHWFPVAFNSAAWAWDIKYVLAKFLFSAGIGLLVFATTGYLPAALILAASSTFIGFFAFRFNHPEIFSLCYSPWILLAWVEILAADSWRRRSLWAPVLVLASTMTLNSGAIKEGVIAIVFLQLAGVIGYLLKPMPSGQKLRLGVFLGVTEVLFLLAASPFWVSFLETLRVAATVSDLSSVQTFHPAELILFFERMVVGWTGANVLPSANLLIYLGVGLAYVRPREFLRNHAFVSSSVVLLISLAVSYGMIPDKIILSIPLVRNIGHIWTAFGDVAIVCSMVVAGFGIRYFLLTGAGKGWSIPLAVLFGITGLLIGSYYWYYTYIHKIQLHYYGVVLLYMLSILVLPLAVRRVLSGWTRHIPATVLVLFFIAVIHIRHGIHLETGFISIDQHVANLRIRPDFSIPSPAIELLKKQFTGPARVEGVNFTIFPGYQGMIGLESINAPDALFDQNYRALTKTFGFNYAFGWDWIMPVAAADVSRLSRPLDLFNVKYLAFMPGTPVPVAGMREVARSDLTIMERPTAWPRAFFVNRVIHYKGPADLAAYLASSDGKPFAAIEEGDAEAAQAVSGLTGSGKTPIMSEAADYRLTNNTTAFRIEAPEAGIAVLQEAYYPDSFEVTVDGARVPYFRVNHAFKAVVVDRPGAHRIEFDFVPRYWALVKILWLLGVGGLIALVGFGYWRDKRRI